MSITWKYQGEGGGDSDHTNNKTRTRVWDVYVTNYETQAQIEADSSTATDTDGNLVGLTRYYIPNPYNNSTTQVFLHSVNLSPPMEDVGGGKKKYQFTATYKSQFPELKNLISNVGTPSGGGSGSGGAQDQNPSNRLPEVESDSWLSDVELTKDVIIGTPITTSAFENVRGLKQQKARGKYIISKSVAPMTTSYLQFCLSYVGRTCNDDLYLQFPAYTMKLMSLKVKEDIPQNGHVTNWVTMEFDLEFDTFNGVQGWYWTEYANAGFYELKNNKQVLIQVDGRPTTVPRFLNNAGQALPLGSPPTYKYAHTLLPANYSLLPF